MNAAATVVQVDWASLWTAIAGMVVTVVIAMIVGVFTISRLITKAFHTVDKRIHGVEIIVGPYSKKLEDTDNILSTHADRLAKIEATQEARATVIDRHERILEGLARR